MLLFISFLFVLVLALLLPIGLSLQGGQQTTFTRVPMAVVLPPRDLKLRLLPALLNQVQSIEENLNLIPVSSEQIALDMLEDGQVVAAFIIPAGFIEAFQGGSDTPARFIVAPGYYSEELLLANFAEAATGLLLTTRHAINATLDQIEARGVKLTSKMIDDVNQDYLNLFWTRLNMFSGYDVEAIQQTETFIFYVASALLTLFLLSGCFLGSLFVHRTPSLLLRLRSEGIAAGTLFFSGWLQVAFVQGVLFLIAGCAWMALHALGTLTVMQEPLDIVQPEQMLALFAVFLFVCSWLWLLLQLSRSQTSAALSIFLLTVAAMFSAGLLLPKALLPQALITWSSRAPITSPHKLLRFALSGRNADSSVLLRTFFFTAVAFLLSIPAFILRQRNERRS